MSDLATLKRLDFPGYLTRRGYQVRPGSTAQSRVMALGDDKIILKRDGDRWVFCTIGTQSEGGTILDFVMTRDNLDFHHAAVSLSDEHLIFTPTEKSPSAPPPPDPEADRARIAVGWNAARWLPDHPYLLSRGIPPAVLHDPRFADCFRLTSKAHALFPHRDDSGLCGLEIRGQGVKVFSRGGRKGLWITRGLESAARIVLCEGVISALSFHALHMDAADSLYPLGYVAFGGGIGGRQRALLTRLFDRYQDREIIVATDNDAAGADYFEALSLLSPVALTRMTPVSADWNDDLEAQAREVA